MNLRLYAHPFSSYCQKVLIALYDNNIPFELRMLGPETPGNFAELARMWPLQRFPVLVDADRVLMEASIIIEHISLHYAEPGGCFRSSQRPRSISASWIVSLTIMS